MKTIRISLELYENLGINLGAVTNIPIKFPTVTGWKVNLDNYGRVIATITYTRNSLKHITDDRIRDVPIDIIKVDTVEIRKTSIEVNFDEIRNTKLPDIYPKADSTWYKKWKEENPDFKCERERYEKRK